MTLMGKYKNQEWEEIDQTNPDSEHTEQEQQTYLKNEYQLAFGREWMFKVDRK